MNSSQATKVHSWNNKIKIKSSLGRDSHGKIKTHRIQKRKQHGKKQKKKEKRERGHKNDKIETLGRLKNDITDLSGKTHNPNYTQEIQSTNRISKKSGIPYRYNPQLE